MKPENPLWTPAKDAIDTSALGRFMREASIHAGDAIGSYRDLHRWSVENPEAFWALLWIFCGVVGERGERVIVDGDRMPGASFFPDASLNFSENLLRRGGDQDALVFRGEDKAERRLSWDELHAEVSRVQQLLSAHGVKPGDRVAAMMPNMPETVIAMLAAVALGAIWSSCSPDFGEQGVLDRFGQIEPVVFLAPDGYWYNGKHIDVSSKVAAVMRNLPTVRLAIIVDYTGHAAEAASCCRSAATWTDALAPYAPGPLSFVRLPFAHPLYILFSSGTTGVPKCIVHCAGGVLLQHLKEHKLNSGVVPGDRFFHFTTCGWMMWNWMTSSLASEATLLLYDGSPTYPSEDVLFDFANDEGATYFGTSAKFIDLLKKNARRPIATHALERIRLISSTGSPLSADAFDYVYACIKRDVHLASIAGGTDVVTSFLQGVPDEPVWAGEIQGPALGMAVDIFDDDGVSLRMAKGELVCTRPFPTMPLMFWNDADGAKYRAAYFERYPGVWCQGDYAETTARGGVIIHGRSDATLNPGGVRIGTSEIYRLVDQMPEILESVCIGQNWDNDVRVVLFIRLAEGVQLDEQLKTKIRSQIRSGASPRHVPAKVIAVSEIPRTKSGKITELAIRDIVHGRTVKNAEALANSDALALYRDIPELSV